MPHTQQVAPYGSWKSPITADLVANAKGSPSSIAVDRADIYWLESRPTEGGRNAILHLQPDGTIRECTPAEYNVRSTVHEYGGGAYTVHGGIIYFANFRDQRIYRQSPGEQPTLLTRLDGCRYADLRVDSHRDRLVCIREDHRPPGEAVNTIVGIDCAGTGNERLMVGGNDFYSSARLSPDGNHLAYLTWNHPNMPWDGCELWVAELDADGMPQDAGRIAGGSAESIFQPEWSPDGFLHFVSDRSGWWNLYRWTGDMVEPLLPMPADFGRSQFQFGMSLYAFASSGRILCAYTRNGSWNLASLDSHSRDLTEMQTGFSEISDVHCGEHHAVFLAGSPTSPVAVRLMDPENGRIQTIPEAPIGGVDPKYYSLPQAVNFPTAGGLEAHGFYYPPHNPDYSPLPNERPPLLVVSHGGPTSATSSVLSDAIQFWTSRGFGVLDVNYGGSTGYGRAYRERLNGKWGIVDVDDCCNGALYLAEKGQVDRQRLAIRGRSAGGFTTLACLAFRSDVFSAGASLYGVADLESFVQDTHKFESRYLSTLVGPYPERRDLYVERSPINSADKFSCPLILLQGEEDRVVPPSQAVKMFEAVRRKGLPAALLLLSGEQHGFRKAANIKRALEAELYFYAKVFRFVAADPIEAVPMDKPGAIILGRPD